MDHDKKLEEGVWTEFGKELLDKDDPHKKRLKFLWACKEGKESFLQYLEDHLFDRKGCVVDRESVDFKHKFSEKEFFSPPSDTQEIIWETFKDIPAEEKMKCGFWGSVIIQLIESDLIKPYYLARQKKDKNGNGSLHNLDEAVKSNHDKKIDSCIRRILNSMGNKSPRGSARVLYDNFSLGRAYWNYHWANQMEEVIGLSVKEILRIFKDIGTYSQFSEKMFSGKSYISQKNVLGGLLLFLKGKRIKSTELGKLIDKISYISAWKAIEAQTPEQNCKEIAQIINN